MKANRKKLTPIQASAQGEECTVAVLGIKCSPRSTTVLAHKTDTIYQNSPRRCDTRAAYACMNCHDVLDGRTPYHWLPYQKAATWGSAIEQTHVRLIEKGLIKIAGEADPGLPKQLPRRTT